MSRPRTANDTWLRQQKRLLFELDFPDCVGTSAAKIGSPTPDELVRGGLALMAQYQVTCTTPRIQRRLIAALESGLLLDEVERYLRRQAPACTLDDSHVSDLRRQATRPGRLVPIQTRSGRGARVNDCIAQSPAVALATARRAIVYVGIGYPPDSLAEFAKAAATAGAVAPVVGVEQTIAAEVLHCDDGLAVLFDDSSRVLNVQWTAVGRERYLRVLEDWESNVGRWTEMRNNIARERHSLSSRGEPRLIRRPYDAYLNRPNGVARLHIVAGDFSIPLRGADVAVVINVLRHYPQEIGQRAIRQMTECLGPNGRLVIGQNAMDGVSFAFARVSQRVGSRLVEREVIISMNLRSLERELGDESQSFAPARERRLARHIAMSAAAAGLDFTAQPYSDDLYEPFAEFIRCLTACGRHDGYEVCSIGDTRRPGHPTGWLTVRFTDH